MQDLIEQLVRSIFKKKSLAECSKEELQQVVEQYPYFGPAQLLLAKKMKEENDPAYKGQLQKTSLYFNDPVWLDHLINETGEAETISAIKEEKISVKEIEIKKAQETDLIFEPYHTVDYFASQGVKIKDEERPKDKFGQQLKSFTEWLKAMKRLPAQEVVKTVDVNSEKKVEQLAEHSIEDRDVVTEAMADVWEKQGNSAKAIEIYNKLSLLNPSKSSYFAAKIEQLKKP
jgi:hypothetical protein